MQMFLVVWLYFWFFVKSCGAFTHIRQRCFTDTIWLTSNSDNDGSVQDCSNSIANALELLQFCTKPLI